MANSKKRCKYCKEYVQADRGVKVPAGFFCSMSHASSWAREKVKKDNERKKAAAAKEQRKKTREDKLRIETIRQTCGKAQEDFNRLICTYDRIHYGCCISGGGPVQEAGHLYHRGSKYGVSWLTFFHANLHGQSTHDNCFKGGEGYNYRRGLIARHGKDWLLAVERMKQLEDRGELPKPTKEEVRAMAKWCRAMTRLYQKMGKSEYV